MIGKVANMEYWDLNNSPPLCSNLHFCRMHAAKAAGIRRGAACRIEFEGKVFVLGAYTQDDEIGPLSAVVDDNKIKITMAAPTTVDPSVYRDPSI